MYKYEIGKYFRLFQVIYGTERKRGITSLSFYVPIGNLWTDQREKIILIVSVMAYVYLNMNGVYR